MIIRSYVSQQQDLFYGIPHAVAAPQLADANHDALIIIGDDFSL